MEWDDLKPILVERYEGDQACTLWCTCGYEWVEQHPEDLNGQSEFQGCPRCGGYSAEFKFFEADRCPNCKTLGFHPDHAAPCCSQLCASQWGLCPGATGPEGRGGGMTYRFYSYRIYPTVKQAAALNVQLAACCDLYNAALEQRIRAWKECGVRVGLFDQSRHLTDLRSTSLMPDMPRKAQEDVLRRLERSMEGFFRRVKRGDAPGFPRFRSASRYTSITWPWGSGIRLYEGRLSIRGVGAVRLKKHREVPEAAVVRTATVQRIHEKWYLSLVVKLPSNGRFPSSGSSVGVDRGVTVPYALSTGELIQGPRARKMNASSVRRVSRTVARRQLGSSRQKKAYALLARQREREANRRRDFLHKLSRRLINEFDVITFEDLKVAQMVRRNRGLNREILDQGWGELVRMTSYKAEWAGRQVILVNPAYTSQTCFECGSVDKKNRRAEGFLCLACGHSDHADLNAASLSQATAWTKNINRAGLALQASTVGADE